MRLTVLGCSGSMPGPDSPAAGYLVRADGFSLGLDLGNGAFGAMQRHLDPSRLDALALSHLHPDHCGDVTALVVYRRYHPDRAADQQPMPLFGPSETAARIAAAYAPSAYELAETDLSDVLDVRVLDSSTIRIGPLALAATPVAHLCEAYALRVECGGTSLVYTGDTGPCRALEEFAAGADVLLAEATWTHDESRPPDIHLSGIQAGELATASGVGRLLLTHIAPWTDASTVLAEARQAFSGPVELVAAGRHYELRAGTTS
jgi:ribonuclease BN (tRNA processing enzyme)